MSEPNILQDIHEQIKRIESYIIPLVEQQRFLENEIRVNPNPAIYPVLDSNFRQQTYLANVHRNLVDAYNYHHSLFQPPLQGKISVVEPPQNTTMVKLSLNEPERKFYRKRGTRLALDFPNPREGTFKVGSLYNTLPEDQRNFLDRLLREDRSIYHNSTIEKLTKREILVNKPRYKSEGEITLAGQTIERGIESKNYLDLNLGSIQNHINLTNGFISIVGNPTTEFIDRFLYMIFRYAERVGVYPGPLIEFMKTLECERGHSALKSSIEEYTTYDYNGEVSCDLNVGEVNNFCLSIQDWLAARERPIFSENFKGNLAKKSLNVRECIVHRIRKIVQHKINGNYNLQTTAGKVIFDNHLIYVLKMVKLSILIDRLLGRFN